MTVCLGPHSDMIFSMDDYGFQNTLIAYYCGKGVDYDFCDGTCGSGKIL